MFAASKTDSVSGAGPDAQFNQVTMLLHGDGTNGAQNNTFVDNSTNNFTVTRFGNTTQGSFSPYGSNWSNYFSSGNWLDSSANSAFSFTGNFTVECWVYQTERGNNGVATEIGLYTDGVMIRLGTIGGIYDTVYVNNVNIGGISTYVPLNSWNHIAVVRSGTSITVYVNGTSRATGTFSGTVNGAVGGTRIGAPLHTTGTDQPFSGYISNFRIVKGTAVYTTAFTPSTTNLTAITNTSFLTCQSNRFVDNSASPKTLTVNGNTSVQRFNPFGTSTAYSTSVIGGSGYFDGSGDYLDTPTSSAFAFGTGDFTSELWVYLSRSNGTIIYEPRSSGQENNPSIAYGVVTSGKFEVITGSVQITSSSSFAIAQWHHVAIVRSGTTLTLWVNGTSQGTSTLSTNLTNNDRIRVGDYFTAGSYPFQGYVSNLRVVKGTAVYTSAFTPPTAPLTAISGTSLLTNFTNGAIFDNAMMNDLETVGNAQISTSVKKFGTGSLAFDGTDDRLVQNASLQIAFGTGDFTIEAWIYSLDVSSDTQRGWLQTSSTAGGLATAFTNGVTFVFGTPNGNGTINAIVGGTNYASSGGAVSSSTWTHIAVTRASGAVKLFVNGTSVASGTGNTANLSGQFICIGGYYSTAYLYNGYIDDLRITKGFARYTANFTAPTSALSDTGPY